MWTTSCGMTVCIWVTVVNCWRKDICNDYIRMTVTLFVKNYCQFLSPIGTTYKILRRVCIWHIMTLRTYCWCQNCRYILWSTRMHKGNYRKFHYLSRVLCSVICMCITFAGLANGGRLSCFVSEFLILPSVIVLSHPFCCLSYFHSLPTSFISLHYFKTLSSYPFLISFVSFIPLSVLHLSLIVFSIPFIYIFHNSPSPPSVLSAVCRIFT